METPALRRYPSQGLITVISQFAKSSTFRVATAAPRECAIAAI